MYTTSWSSASFWSHFRLLAIQSQRAGGGGRLRLYQLGSGGRGWAYYRDLGAFLDEPLEVEVVARDPPLLSVGQMSSATASTFIESRLAPSGDLPAGRGSGG